MRCYLLVLAAFSLIIGTSARAEGPSFAPYGAWRGKVRYVAGPHRVKERVRWGNGVTPVGGQVLIQGFASAADVFSGRQAFDDASARDSSTHSSILGAYGRLLNAQQQTLDKLNKTRDKLELQPLEFLPEAVNATPIAQNTEASVDFGDAFIGSKDSFGTDNPKSLFPKVDAGMRKLLLNWNALAGKVDGKIAKNDAIFASELQAGLESYLAKISPIYTAYKQTVGPVKKLSATLADSGKTLAEKYPAEWQALVDSLKSLKDLNAAASDFSTKHQSAATILEAKSGTFSRKLKLYRAIVKDLSELFAKPEIIGVTGG
jgi:hypothetical protein